MTTRKTQAQRRREATSERLALLVAYAFQAPWAAKHLPPESDARPNYTPEYQLKYQFMLVARKIAPHLQFEIGLEDTDIHRLWHAAKVLHEAGPLPITKREADFMRSAVLDMETSAKIYRAQKHARRSR
jgi:hypothetical protein